MSAITRHSDKFYPGKLGKFINFTLKTEFSTMRKVQKCIYIMDACRESKNEFFIVFVRCLLGWKKYRFL